jgi:hypothetical protein
MTTVYRAQAGDGDEEQLHVYVTGSLLLCGDLMRHLLDVTHDTARPR